MKRKPFALGGSQSYEAPLYFPYKYMSTRHSPSQSFWLTMEHFNNDDLEYIVHFQDDFPTVISITSLLLTPSFHLIHQLIRAFCNNRLIPLVRKPETGKIFRESPGRGLTIAETNTVRPDSSNTKITRTSLSLLTTSTRSVSKCRRGKLSMTSSSIPGLSNPQLSTFREFLLLFAAILALRNLLWATSKHDVYLMQNYSVMHWSALLQRSKEVLNVAKPIIPTLTHPGFLAQPVSRVQISTMTVKENLMVAGGFQGELICKNLKQPGVLFCGKITTDGNAITNAVDVYRNPAGSLRVITANNDSQLRVFDAENFASLGCFKYDWSVNNTSISPDGRLLAVLGDSTECLMADANSGKITGSLKGHLDYSFSSAWHPNGQILATGNQDKTCRLWDIRNLSQSMAVLKGRMGAIRALRFTSDGRFLAMAEPADFVHIFDSHSGYEQGQEIDLFGEIAGISFSPDTEALFVGIADRTYGSLLEFNRKRHYNYLDSF
ncbi:putative WD repeat-containing protein C2A9.03 [Glycine soja]|uniref:Putative WD repeat-containing protein C2A9.03 n=1 Tax=Glycine soja TaxID=3848 RepID=A0A445K7P4_GLYSO|nr:putative WD repeat-containing protein C2A9.03 [Glycine soja]